MGAVLGGNVSDMSLLVLFGRWSKQSLRFRKWWLLPRLRGLWENVRPLFPRLHFFFFKVEIISHTLMPLFMPGSVHSGSGAEKTVAECSLTSCVELVSRQVPTLYLDSGMVGPLRLRSAKVMSGLNTVYHFTTKGLVDCSCHMSFYGGLIESD